MQNRCFFLLGLSLFSLQFSVTDIFKYAPSRISAPKTIFPIRFPCAKSKKCAMSSGMYLYVLLCTENKKKLFSNVRNREFAYSSLKAVFENLLDLVVPPKQNGVQRIRKNNDNTKTQHVWYIITLNVLHSTFL